MVNGAGSAGCVLAAWLSQDPDIRVALLEAGGPDDAPEISMPVAVPQLFNDQVRLGIRERAGTERRIYLPHGKTPGALSCNRRHCPACNRRFPTFPGAECPSL